MSSYPFTYAPELKHDLLPYLAQGDLTPKFKAFVDSIPRDKVRTIDFLVSLNQRLQKDIFPTPEGTAALGKVVPFSALVQKRDGTPLPEGTKLAEYLKKAQKPAPKPQREPASGVALPDPA